jgi:hypothetical protein
MVETEVKERQGAERLRREVEEERERDALRELIEEADRLEMVKGGMDKRIEEIDMETVKRRRD